MFTTNWMGPYQPLAWVSLAVDHALFGFEPRAFHRSALAWHALATLAVFGLARAVLARAPPRTGSRDRNGPRMSPLARELAAAAGALFFALHPLRVESVAWVTERRDLLSGLGYALAAWAWVGYAQRARERPSLHPRSVVVGALASAAALALFLASVDRTSTTRLALAGPGWLGLSLALAALGVAVRALTSGVPGGTRRYLAVLPAFLFALLSKGTAVVLPAVLCVLDVVPLRRRAGPALVLEKLPLFALSTCFALLAVWGQGRGGEIVRPLAEHGPFERAVQGLYALAYYPARTLVPLGLSPLYELPSEVRLEGRFLAAALAVLGAFAVAWSLRRRAPALLAALVAFALAIAPVSGLLQTGPQLVADRYSYLAGLPFALLFAGTLAHLARTLEPGRWTLWLAVPWLAALGALTFDYTRAWRDTHALWSRALEVDPESSTALFALGTERARAAAELGDVAARRAAFAAADDLIARALAVADPATIDPRIPAGLARVRAARARLEPKAPRQHLEDAARLSAEAVRIGSEQGRLVPTFLLALGLDLAALGRHAEAREPLERYTRIEPRDPRGFEALARAEEALGRRRRADAAWRALLALEPSHAEARARLGE